MKVNELNYNFVKDIEFFMDSEKINLDDLSALTGISRTTLNEVFKVNNTIDNVYEKFYSCVYKTNYRLNSVKEDLLKETTKEVVLFHGSKYGLNNISLENARSNCDFGKGFYLGETYEQALSFVCENPKSTVYSFTCDLSDLKIKKYDCTLEWMIAICYYRGTIIGYENANIVKKIIKEIEESDLIIAPIADNRMFYIMSLFAQGDINADVALHSLSASKLGLQYIFKTEKALQKLKAIEKYYLCKEEKKDCHDKLNSRSLEIDTKLKMSRREFRDGLFIEELLK